ncbi:MFS transporter [Microbacterium indicum]|uniref:MFS transporter n=1 Tax=Microbacterium indicum TaxID=358100 RepID=UPI0003FBB459|nr:MFS transporter [Microbacterium indicum]
MSHSADPSSFSGPLPLQPDEPGASIWSRRFVWTTLGAVALIFLAAIQSLAVTTVMPVVAADLDGGSLYALAFSGTFATSVIGMVAAGSLSDRRGPGIPITAAVALFLAGVVIDAAAPTMEILVVGRLVMGLGSGGLVVSLYVIVARVYPANLHGRVLALFAAAWVVPSLIGPALAGAVTEYLHWRWVFGGVAILAVASFAMLAPRLRSIPHADEKPEDDRFGRRIALSVVVAVGALLLNLAGELPTTAARAIVAVAALAVVLIAMRPLLPRGTFTAARGLPSVVLLRGVIAGALFGAEIYVPYLFQAEYGFSPTFAGLALTAAAITWAVGSEVSGRRGDRMGNRRVALTGIALLASALVVMLLSALLGLAPWIPIAFWGLAGLGMGFMHPRTTVLALAYSSRTTQGFNSSAIQISDAVGTAASMAIMGLIFTAVPDGFPLVFGLALLIALAALVPGLRLGHARELRR